MAHIARSIGLVALLVTQACWLQVGGGPQRRGFSALEADLTAATVGDLSVAWTASVGPAAPFEVLIYGDGVYVPWGDSITRLDADDGSEQWTWTPPMSISHPAIADDRLWVATGGDRCILVGVDLATGTPVDLLPVGPPAIRPDFDTVSMCTPHDPVVSGTTVTVPWFYIGAGDVDWCPDVGYQQGPGVTALDVDDRALRWEWLDTDSGCGQLPPNYPSQYGGYSAPGPDGIVMQATFDTVRAVDCGTSGCQEPWNVRLDPAGSPIILPGGDVAVRTSQGKTHVIDHVDHTVAWTGDVGSWAWTQLAADGSNIVAVTNTGTVAVFPLAGCGAPTCEPLWVGATPADVSGAPAIADGRVIVGSRDGTVTAFALADG